MHDLDRVMNKDYPPGTNSTTTTTTYLLFFKTSVTYSFKNVKKLRRDGLGFCSDEWRCGGRIQSDLRLDNNNM